MVIQRGSRFVLVSIKLVASAALESDKTRFLSRPGGSFGRASGARMQIEGRDANSHNTNSSGGATVTVVGRESSWSELLRQFVI